MGADKLAYEQMMFGKKIAYGYVKWPKMIYWGIIININKGIIGKSSQNATPSSVSIS